MQNIIECQNAGKKYRRGKEVIRALFNINLTIPSGEFVAVMGPSGSGKSTLLNLLGGLDEPTEGEIFVMGRNINILADDEKAEFRRDMLGFVFQFFHLQTYNTIFENVMLPFLFDDAGSSQHTGQNMELAHKAIADVGLKNRWDHRLDELSGGEKQRAAIARAIVKNPNILLADEPTGNLDRSSADSIMRLFCELHEKHKMTIVLVTHDETAALHAQRIIKLDKGGLL